MTNNRLNVGDRVYDTKGYIWIITFPVPTVEGLWYATREDDGLDGTLDEKDMETLTEREQTDDEITAFLTDDDEPAPNHSTDPELEQYMHLLKKLVKKKVPHPLYPEEITPTRIPYEKE